MSDAIINKLIIVTQTSPSPSSGKQFSQNKNTTVSTTSIAPNFRRQDTRLNEEMEHGLRSYEEELWSTEGIQVCLNFFFWEGGYRATFT